MKWLIATLVALTAISGLSFAASSPAEAATGIEVHPQSSPNLTTAAPDEDTAAEAALLESVNRSRKQAGGAPVRMEESLRQAARLHARRMVATRQLEHQFPGEPSLLQRIADVSSLPLDRAGENIANASCPQGAVDVLMHSPPHRQNILDPHFNVAGIVAIWSHGRLYVVQDFGHAMSSYSAHETAQRVGEGLNHVRASNGLSELAPFSPPHLDEAACALAKEDRPNARIVAASYTNRKVITYTQSTPDVLPPAASDAIHHS